MPSRPISALGDGLLSLLAMKNLGKLPIELADSVQPTVDMEPWYLRAAAVGLIFDRVQIVGTALGFVQWQVGGVNLVVPENEWWYLHDFMVGLDAPLSPTAAELVLFQPAYGVPPTNFASPLGNPITHIASANELVAGLGYRTSVRDVWLPPSSKLYLYTAFTEVLGGGAPFELFGMLRYTPLRA